MKTNIDLSKVDEWDLFPELSKEDKCINDLMVQFSNEVRETRKKLNVSQAELSKRCNVKQPLICRWESAEENVTLSTIAKIACALDVEVEIKFRIKGR